MKARNERRNIDDLIPYENNPRRNEEAVPFVGNSIEEFDYINPIVVNADNVILAGHTRLQALKNAGYTGELDVRVVDYLTPEQEKAYRLADNKTAEFSAWDYSKLDEEIGTLDLDLSAFGFFGQVDDLDIDKFFEETEEKAPKEPVTHTAVCPCCGETIIITENYEVLP